MSRIKGIEEEIVEARKVMDDIYLVTQTESRLRKSEETVSWNSAKEKINSLELELVDLKEYEEGQIKRAAESAKKEERLAASVAGAGSSKSEEREQNGIKKSFNLSAAIKAVVSKQPLEGREAEINQEAQTECRNAQAAITLPGQISMPSWMLEKRTDIDQATSAIQPTAVEGYVQAIRENSVHEQLMPANNIRRGLTADLKLVNVDPQSLAWASAENSAAADGGANFGKDTLSPIRLTGYADVSNRVILQNGDAAINSLMIDFGREIANKIDQSIFATADVSNAPPSIGATSGVKTFTETGTYAAASATVYGSVYADVLLAMQTLANAGGLQGSLGFAGHTKLLSDLLKSSRTLGVAPVVSQTSVGAPLSFMIEGIKWILTTANTSNGTVSADFLGGDFSKFFVGHFGGISIDIDPWTVKLNDQVRIIVHKHVDTSLLMGEAMVKSTTLLA
jgi:hypothetical protein